MKDKKKKIEDFSFEIKEFIGVLKESDKHDWCKAVTKISWNDNPPTIDIRNINVSQNKIGKGISLTDEEADRLVDILLENDYGSLDILTKALERKRSRFTVLKDFDQCFTDDDKIVIDVEL